MEFNVTLDLDMDGFSNDGDFDERGFSECMVESVKESLADTIVDRVLHTYGREHGETDLNAFVRNGAEALLNRTFNNSETVREVKDKVADKIAEKYARKRELAASQFDVKQFVSLDPVNKKYLMEIIDECIAKKFK